MIRSRLATPTLPVFLLAAAVVAVLAFGITRWVTDQAGATALPALEIEADTAAAAPGALNAARRTAELTAATDLAVTVDGAPVEPVYDGVRLLLDGIGAGEHVVVVDARLPHVTDGDGMHLVTDPADGAEFWRLVRDGNIQQLRSILADGKGTERMVASYRSIIKDRTAEHSRVLHALAEDSVPALMHCAAGKDRAGLSVALIDRGRRGSDTLSTHALMRGGVLQLSRWGVLADVVAAGTPTTAVRAVPALETGLSHRWELALRRDGVCVRVRRKRTNALVRFGTRCNTVQQRRPVPIQYDANDAIQMRCYIRRTRAV